MSDDEGFGDFEDSTNASAQVDTETVSQPAAPTGAASSHEGLADGAVPSSGEDDDEGWGDFGDADAAPTPTAVPPTAIQQPAAIGPAEPSTDILALKGQDFTAAVRASWSILGAEDPDIVTPVAESELAGCRQPLVTAEDTSSIVANNGVPLDLANTTHGTYEPAVRVDVPLQWKGTDSEGRLLTSLGLSEVAAQAKEVEAAEEETARQRRARMYQTSTGLHSGASMGSLVPGASSGVLNEMDKPSSLSLGASNEMGASGLDLVMAAAAQAGQPTIQQMTQPSSSVPWCHTDVVSTQAATAQPEEACAQAQPGPLSSRQAISQTVPYQSEHYSNRTDESARATTSGTYHGSSGGAKEAPVWEAQRVLWGLGQRKTYFNWRDELRSWEQENGAVSLTMLDPEAAAEQSRARAVSSHRVFVPPDPSVPTLPHPVVSDQPVLSDDWLLGEEVEISQSQQQLSAAAASESPSLRSTAASNSPVKSPASATTSTSGGTLGRTLRAAVKAVDEITATAAAFVSAIAVVDELSTSTAAVLDATHGITPRWAAQQQHTQLVRVTITVQESSEEEAACDAAEHGHGEAAASSPRAVALQLSVDEASADHPISLTLCPIEPQAPSSPLATMMQLRIDESEAAHPVNITLSPAPFPAPVPLLTPVHPATVRLHLEVLPGADTAAFVHQQFLEAAAAAAADQEPPSASKRAAPAVVDELFGELWEAQAGVQDQAEEDPASLLEGAFGARLVAALRSFSQGLGPGQPGSDDLLVMDPLDDLDYEQAALVAARALDAAEGGAGEQVLSEEDARQASRLLDALQQGYFKELLHTLEAKPQPKPKPLGMVEAHEQDVIRRHLEWVAVCEKKQAEDAAAAAQAAAALERAQAEAAAAAAASQVVAAAMQTVLAEAKAREEAELVAAVCEQLGTHSPAEAKHAANDSWEGASGSVASTMEWQPAATADSAAAASPRTTGSGHSSARAEHVQDSAASQPVALPAMPSNGLGMQPAQASSQPVAAKSASVDALESFVSIPISAYAGVPAPVPAPASHSTPPADPWSPMGRTAGGAGSGSPGLGGLGLDLTADDAMMRRDAASTARAAAITAGHLPRSPASSSPAWQSEITPVEEETPAVVTVAGTTIVRPLRSTTSFTSPDRAPSVSSSPAPPPPQTLHPVPRQPPVAAGAPDLITPVAVPATEAPSEVSPAPTTSNRPEERSWDELLGPEEPLSPGPDAAAPAAAFPVPRASLGGSSAASPQKQHSAAKPGSAQRIVMAPPVSFENGADYGDWEQQSHQEPAEAGGLVGTDSGCDESMAGYEDEDEEEILQAAVTAAASAASAVQHEEVVAALAKLLSAGVLSPESVSAPASVMKEAKARAARALNLDSPGPSPLPSANPPATARPSPAPAPIPFPAFTSPAAAPAAPSTSAIDSLAALDSLQLPLPDAAAAPASSSGVVASPAQLSGAPAWLAASWPPVQPNTEALQGVLSESLGQYAFQDLVAEGLVPEHGGRRVPREQTLAAAKAAANSSPSAALYPKSAWLPEPPPPLDLEAMVAPQPAQPAAAEQNGGAAEEDPLQQLGPELLDPRASRAALLSASKPSRSKFAATPAGAPRTPPPTPLWTKLAAPSPQHTQPASVPSSASHSHAHSLAGVGGGAAESRALDSASFQELDPLHTPTQAGRPFPVVEPMRAGAALQMGCVASPPPASTGSGKKKRRKAPVDPFLPSPASSAAPQRHAAYPPMYPLPPMPYPGMMPAPPSLGAPPGTYLVPVYAGPGMQQPFSPAGMLPLPPGMALSPNSPAGSWASARSYYASGAHMAASSSAGQDADVPGSTYSTARAPMYTPVAGGGVQPSPWGSAGAYHTGHSTYTVQSGAASASQVQAQPGTSGHAPRRLF